MKRNFGVRGFGCAASLALLSLATGHAAAQDRPATPVQGPLGNHQRNVRVEIGVRTQFIKSSGFDPFSARDALPQLSLGASLAFLRQDKWSLAAMAGYDYGGTAERLRSDRASLDLHRFTLAPEVRYHLLRVLALTARVGPTLTREGAEVSGPLGTSLLKTGWKFGFDATAGAAVELWGYADGASHKPRVWLVGEGGYGWSAPMALKFKPEKAGAAPERLDPLDLGELSLAGPLFRITVGLSFW